MSKNIIILLFLIGMMPLISNKSWAELLNNEVWVNVYHDNEAKVLINNIKYDKGTNSLDYDKAVIYKDKITYSQINLDCRDNFVKDEHRWTLNIKDDTTNTEPSDYYFLENATSASYTKQTYCGLSTTNSTKKFLFSFPVMKK